MNAYQRKQLDGLKRRRGRLVQRVSGQLRDGSVETAKRELSAINYAIRVIQNCEAAGILNEVDSR